MKLIEALDYVTIGGLLVSAYVGGDFAAPYIAQLSPDIGPLTAKVTSIGVLESLVAIFAGRTMNRHYHGTNKVVHFDTSEPKLEWDADQALTYRDMEMGEHPYKTGV